MKCKTAVHKNVFDVHLKLNFVIIETLRATCIIIEMSQAAQNI